MQIETLTLYTHCLAKLKEFYSKALNIPITSEDGKSFSFQIGSTSLSFIETSEVTYYHFAINIPSFQIEEAYQWVKERTEILPFQGSEIVDFKNWNANAIYFYDPAGNIVEFIARKNLGISNKEEFTPKSLLNVSEMGFPVTDVKATFDLLHSECGLTKYSGDYSRFCALGEETGLFIIVDYNQKDWIPNGDAAQPFPFEISFIHNQNLHKLVYYDEQLKLS